MPKPLFPAVGDSILHFQLEGELGSGAFSRVFLASQRDLAERLVALKITEYADGEPQRLARLQHANIVPIYSVHHHYQFQVVCMPYVGSHTLATLLKHHRNRPRTSGRELVETLRNRSLPAGTTVRDSERERVLPAPAPTAPLSPNLELLKRLSHVDAVLWIVARLADGLAHAHERGILHCDLKPQNILIADDGQPMLLDFNVALETRPGAAQRSCYGGTVPYMAPEHLESIAGGQPVIDVRADLYSLGVILFELLTGQDPHGLAVVRPRDTPGELAVIRRRQPDRPSRYNQLVTPAIDDIVCKLLAPNPERRYASAAELQEDLERHLANRPLKHAPNTSLVERCIKWRRRNPRLAAVALATTLTAVLIGTPAVVLAVRQDQMAREHEAGLRAEAAVGYSTALDQVRAAQIMLSTQTGNRALLDQGFTLGRKVLEKYGVGSDVAWADRPLFCKLPPDLQLELRREFGELIMLMSRGETIRDAGAVQAAVGWNVLAEQCFPAGERPRALARQRAELLAKSPGSAEPLADTPPTELDAYYDGLETAARGRYAEALTKLVPFADRHPDHFMSWYVRGISHEGVGQMTDAAAAFTVCAALRPEMPWPPFSRGLVRLQQRRFEEAEKDFAEALRLKPEWTSALINRAIAREGRRDYKGADEDLTGALARPDAPTRILFFRSKIRAKAGDAKGAERDAAEAMKLTPTDAVSCVTRGAWRMEANPTDALADFEHALKIDPRSRDGLQNKAVVLADYLNQPKEAVATMDRLLELYPHHVEARAGRGVYLARLGEVERAKRDAADCLRDEPTAYRFFQMAGLYAQLSRKDTDGNCRREAFRLLALAVRNGFANLALMAKDTDLDPIRNSDEFKTLSDHARALLRQ
jgi:serine/threonine protein kinase/Flp pilus assembly protein TadD